MKLEKQPQTEMEYWQVIEGLGGMMWGLNHDLADGRIEDDKNKTMDKGIREMRELSTRLVSELEKKFGVIPPQKCPKPKAGKEPPPAPKGKKYYWDWYKKMKEAFYKTEYEKIICSACPLSEGVKQMISSGGNIPCGPFSGSIFQLQPPFSCAMLSDHWDEQRLRQEIIKKGGDAAYAKFKIKEAGLKTLFDSGKGEIVVN